MNLPKHFGTPFPSTPSATMSCCQTAGDLLAQCNRVSPTQHPTPLIPHTKVAHLARVCTTLSTDARCIEWIAITLTLPFLQTLPRIPTIMLGLYRLVVALQCILDCPPPTLIFDIDNPTRAHIHALVDAMKPLALDAYNTLHPADQHAARLNNQQELLDILQTIQPRCQQPPHQPFYAAINQFIASVCSLLVMDHAEHRQGLVTAMAQVRTLPLETQAILQPIMEWVQKGNDGAVHLQKPSSSSSHSSHDTITGNLMEDPD